MPYNKRKKKQKPASPRQRTGDYRIFIGAFPSGEWVERIQAVRQQYDPKTAQISAAHVTLAGTYWREGPANAHNESKLINHLSTLSALLPPFDLQLGGIYNLGQRVVYLGVKPTPALQKVRTAVVTQAGRDKHRQYKPHLTLAMHLEPTAFAAMIDELQQTEWHTERFKTPINELHLMLRGKKDPAWRSIFSFPLEGQNITTA